MKRTEAQSGIFLRSQVGMASERRIDIASRIHVLRGVQVMLDWDIAACYGVETRALNQAVKRNLERFPDRFRFQLTKAEMAELITNCDKSGSYLFGASLKDLGKKCFAFTKLDAAEIPALRVRI